MINLFHGSYIAVKEPLAKTGRRNLDFGAGFYVTRLREQAQKWAKVVAGRNPDYESGIVTEYEMDDTVLNSKDVVYKCFPSYDISWLDFVVACRQGKDNTLYDIVDGGVANDQVIDTVEDYENGRITAEQALDQLRFKKPNNQICIRNQQIIDKYLHFKSVEVVALNDETI